MDPRLGVICDNEGNSYMWSNLHNCLVKTSCENNNKQFEEIISENILLLTEECNDET